jgi:CubicO group peptidase (beta-lactamase class C family)
MNARARHSIVLGIAMIVALPCSVVAQVARTAVDRLSEPSALQAIQRFADNLRADVAADSVGGITAAVVAGDSVVWAQGFGWADRDRNVPAGVETIYRTGSISKTFTAVVLLQLVEEGVVGLDDPVVRHLPEFAELQGPAAQIRSITLRQLASHTAGLVREPELENAAAGPIEEWESQVIASLPTTSLSAAPGERYSYSNIGFGILGLTLSRAAGRPFMELVEELIFEPLGMKSSTFILEEQGWARMSVGYANRRDGTVDTERPALEHKGRGYKVPNGGIYSTVHDLGRFIAGLSGAFPSEILSAESRTQMLSVQTPGDSSRAYGLGLQIHVTDDGVRIVGHGGSVAGYTAFMAFNPESSIGVVLLRNYNGGSTNLAGRTVILLEELTTPPDR